MWIATRKELSKPCTPMASGEHTDGWTDRQTKLAKYYSNPLLQFAARIN